MLWVTALLRRKQNEATNGAQQSELIKTYFNALVSLGKGLGQWDHACKRR